MASAIFPIRVKWYWPEAMISDSDFKSKPEREKLVIPKISSYINPATAARSNRSLSRITLVMDKISWGLNAHKRL